MEKSNILGNSQQAFLWFQVQIILFETVWFCYLTLINWPAYGPDLPMWISVFAEIISDFYVTKSDHSSALFIKLYTSM